MLSIVILIVRRLSRGCIWVILILFVILARYLVGSLELAVFGGVAFGSRLGSWWFGFLRFKTWVA